VKPAGLEPRVIIGKGTGQELSTHEFEIICLCFISWESGRVFCTQNRRMIGGLGCVFAVGRVEHPGSPRGVRTFVTYNTARPAAPWHLECVMPICPGVANLSHRPPSVSSAKLLTFWICPRCNQVSTSKYMTPMSSKGVQIHSPCRSSTTQHVRTRTH